VTKRH